jgi:hypothetical protein
MNADRILKRLEYALQHKETKTLPSVARDIGDELIRKRISVLKKFMCGLDRISSVLSADIGAEEKVYLMTITHIISSAIDALAQEEDNEYISRLSDRYLDLLQLLVARRATTTEIAKHLEKKEDSIREALHRLHFAGLVECAGIKEYWELSAKATSLLKQANLAKTAS